MRRSTRESSCVFEMGLFFSNPYDAFATQLGNKNPVLKVELDIAVVVCHIYDRTDTSITIHGQ